MTQCRSSEGVPSLEDITIKKFIAKLNKKRTKMNIKINIVGNLTDGLKSRKLSYKSNAVIDLVSVPEVASALR
jgi:hypothetical protein